MVKEMTEQTPSTKLLTLINVAQARPEKRKRPSSRDWYALAKKAVKTSSSLDEAVGLVAEVKSVVEEQVAEEEEDDDDESKKDAYERHWGAESEVLGGGEDEIKWKKREVKVPGWGKWDGLKVDGKETGEHEGEAGIYNARLLSTFQSVPLPANPPPSSLLSLLSTYSDIFHTSTSPAISSHESLRTSLALHAMNHVHKTRAKVLKNNEHLSKLAATAAEASSSKGKSAPAPTPTRNTQDQGFTRPKVLVLLPFRNSALTWVNLLANISASSTTMIENLTRFQNEYSLPEGAVDKLVENPGNYTKDHVETFKGNIDDSFRLGVKVTRKNLRLFAEFYGADVIVASPLGLRTSIEKEKDHDFLSSIELLIIDQADVMLMQNWDHVQFIMERLNQMPTEAHGADFSRVKPWYLENKAASLRQTILLSAHETPEIRSLYSQLHNYAGKVKSITKHEGVLTNVPSGIKQTFTRFECADVYEEDDKRFEWFTTKTLPMLRKSAVSSSQTIIFVPSYFDFIRVKRHLKKIDDFDFVSISEYSPTSDISRARGAFFSGQTNFLLVTERYHFYRRYRLRGAKTFVFYAPPDHADYYPEFLSFPYPPKNEIFAERAQRGEEEEVDPTELSAVTVFSKFDLLKLERIVGREDAKRMVSGEGERFTFV